VIRPFDTRSNTRRSDASSEMKCKAAAASLLDLHMVISASAFLVTIGFEGQHEIEIRLLSTTQLVYFGSIQQNTCLFVTQG